MLSGAAGGNNEEAAVKETLSKSGGNLAFVIELWRWVLGY
jgi:hypothetical protein